MAHLGQRHAVVTATAASARSVALDEGGPVTVIEVHLPGGRGVEAFVGSVTPPKTLDQHGGRRDLSVEVFLALFLLNFECEAGTQYSL
ncbi:hypothetical protein JTB14_014074 [Gonioctena quinquepunctata]|nr:hypothetical protein JTB14_014074 [Gonioctena quinquepunctata]